MAVAALSALLLVAAMVAVALSPVPDLPNLYMLGGLAFPMVGGLVVTRRPANRVGRLLVATAAWYAVGAAATTYVWLGLEVGPLPASDLAAWLATWAYWPMSVLIVFTVAVFPSGGLTLTWLRWPLRLGAAAVLLLVLPLMIQPGPVNSVLLGEDIRSPWGVEAMTSLVPINDVVMPYLSTALLVLALIDLGLRWRQSRGVERLQMRWFGLGLVLCGLLAIAGIVTFAAGQANELVLVAFWGLGFGALPLSIGVAVTRYRLYDIDRLISRTLTYALLTAGLGATYVGLVVGLQTLLRPISGSNEYAVVVTTLVVAGLFLPARRRVQDAVDRRFNRRTYDAVRTIDAFAARLRQQVDLDTLRSELLAVVDETMEPARASLWLRRQ